MVAVADEVQSELAKSRACPVKLVSFALLRLLLMSPMRGVAAPSTLTRGHPYGQTGEASEGAVRRGARIHEQTGLPRLWEGARCRRLTPSCTAKLLPQHRGSGVTHGQAAWLGPPDQEAGGMDEPGRFRTCGGLVHRMKSSVCLRRCGIAASHPCRPAVGA